MFGGLTKTSSRIAIAAALGMTLGGFAMSATPCQGRGSRWRLLRGSRGEGGGARSDDRPQGQQEGLRDLVRLGGQAADPGGTTATSRTSTWVTRTRPCRATSRFPVARQIAPGWSGGYTIARRSPGQQLLGRLRRESVQRQYLLDDFGGLPVNISVLCPICGSRATDGARSTGVS